LIGRKPLTVTTKKKARQAGSKNKKSKLSRKGWSSTPNRESGGNQKGGTRPTQLTRRSAGENWENKIDLPECAKKIGGRQTAPISLVDIEAKQEEGPPKSTKM